MTHTPTPELLETLRQFQAATNAAKLRTEDNSLSVQVYKGRFRIARITFNKRGVSTVTPVTDWESKDETLAALAKVA